MGEANSEAVALIAKLTGYEPRSGRTEDGRQCLHIGDTVVVAESYSLWSDPSAWQHDDGSLTVRWGGQIVRLSPNAGGEWVADAHPDPMQGKARWVY